MTTISPTRVSMYDFLYQDTQPLVSLLADAAELSLPQTRLALGASLQAIVAALLAYQQRHQGQAINKKLFNRAAVKELRQYNSMNFVTLNATLYHRNDVADAVFHDSARVVKASSYIASQVDATTEQVRTLLTCLCVIVLRELAILADYSKLDNDELDKWFALQPQFLSAERFVKNNVLAVSTLQQNTSPTSQSRAHDIEANKSNQHQQQVSVLAENDNDEESLKTATSSKTEATSLTIVPPPFDNYWYELTSFTPEHSAAKQDMQQATSNYLKAIGRSSDSTPQGHHNDTLVFAQMYAIALPHQRWLLQLAKISDIYLSRNRLRITSEPTTPPTPPLVSLGLIGASNDNTPTTTSEIPIEYDKPKPLWKDPAILILILVIGGLGALATFKYQTQKSQQPSQVISTTEAVSEKQRQMQDVAIVKVDEDDLDSTDDVAPTVPE